MLTSAMGLLTAGCAGNPIVRSVESVAARAVGLPREAEVDRATVAKIPYATIQAKFGDGPATLLILQAYDGARLAWIDTKGTLLVTRTGRLIQTVGFPEDLRHVAIDGPDPLSAAPHDLKSTARIEMQYDLMTATLDVVRLTSRIEPVAPETITILGLDFKTVHLRERCHAVSAKWSFDNEYWVDAYDGFVWRSKQHFARSLPPLTIDVLKPAA
jgi:hypothetical protein